MKGGGAVKIVDTWLKAVRTILDLTYCGAAS